MADELREGKIAILAGKGDTIAVDDTVGAA